MITSTGIILSSILVIIIINTRVASIITASSLLATRLVSRLTRC